MKKPSGKKLWTVTGLSIALIGGTAVWRNAINADPQIVIPPYPKAPTPNGFDVYVKASKMIAQTRPYVDEVDDPKPPSDPKVRAQQYSLANKEAWLKRNAAGFSLMQTALKMQSQYPDYRSTLGPLPFHRLLRELARCKSVERHAREMRGDWNAAVQSQIDTVQMGNDMAHGGNVDAGLVAFAIEGIGRSEPWKSVERLNATQARAASKRLEAIYARRITYIELVREEKWRALASLITIFHDTDSSWRAVSNWNDSPSIVDRIKMFCLSKRAVVNNTIQRLDAQIANAQLPYTSPFKELPSGDPISATVAYDFGKTLRTVFARNDAGNALWLTTLALRAYKLEHNAYPTKLQMLVPNYLKQVPADPFGGGEALRYKIVGNGYLLWSIGPDGIDNNGTPVSWPASASAERRKKLPQVQFDSKGDYVAGKNR